MQTRQSTGVPHVGVTLSSPRELPPVTGSGGSLEVLIQVPAGNMPSRMCRLNIRYQVSWLVKGVWSPYSGLGAHIEGQGRFAQQSSPTLASVVNGVWSC
jgi:hypothetical protein